MGTKTLTQFASALTLELGNRDDISGYTTGWINTAYLTLTTKDKFWGLQKRFYFPELMATHTTTTANGTPYVTLATDTLNVVTAWDSTTDVKLKKTDWRTYVSTTGRSTEDDRSAPQKWCVYGANSVNTKLMYLLPTPDSAYGISVYYRKRPALLSATNTTTALGPEWDEIILKLAVIQSLQRFKQYEFAEIEKKEWLDMVSGLVGIYDVEDIDREDRRLPDPMTRGSQY